MRKWMNRQGIAILLLLIGTLSLLYGIQREEHLLVAKKSNIICLECIGIG